MSAPEQSDEVPVRRPRRELVEAEIYEQATRLFAERGFAGTSLQDIADAMGMTRPSLYYYVKNKDQLLARLVTEITEAPPPPWRRSRSATSTPPPSSASSSACSPRTRRDHAARFRLVIRSESELPGPRDRPRGREAPRARRLRAHRRPGRPQRRVPPAPGADDGAGPDRHVQLGRVVVQPRRFAVRPTRSPTRWRRWRSPRSPRPPTAPRTPRVPTIPRPRSGPAAPGPGLPGKRDHEGSQGL